MGRAEIVRRLESYGWSDEAIRLGERAEFRCEYCDRDLLASVDDYDSWHREHVIAERKGGPPDDFDNLALSCKTCNFLKRTWLPEGHEGKSREELVSIFRRHIQQLRAKKQQAVAEMRMLARQLLDLTKQGGGS